MPSSDSQTAAGNIINMLWQLMENSLEELKLLQTVLVILTTHLIDVYKCFEVVFE